MTPERAPLRIAVLWKQMSGWLDACLGALTTTTGASLYLAYRTPMPEAPFDTSALVTTGNAYRWSDAPRSAELLRELEAFRPNALVVCSWDVGAYRAVARRYRGRAVRLLVMDNQWRSTPKQWAGCVAARTYLRTCFDAVFLPGERQAVFATKLGFPDDRIVRGSLSCDHRAFAGLCGARSTSLPEAFIFIGRLVPAKGIDVLARAYRRYRDQTPRPWPLLVCGTGPLHDEIAAVPGVELRGFVQPRDLVDVVARAGCLVMPSRFEPWGLAIHEAAAAGLPIICTPACGASVELVGDGHNGLLVPAGDEERLALALRRLSQYPAERRATMGANSSRLSVRFTPEQWARHLYEHLELLCAVPGQPAPG